MELIPGSSVGTCSGSFDGAASGRVRRERSFLLKPLENWVEIQPTESQDLNK